MTIKSNLTGWIGAAATFLLTELENVFPSLAAIGSSIVSGFSKQEASLIWSASRGFVQDMESGTSWTDAFNKLITEMKTGELAILSNEAKSFLYMFAHKSRPKA